MHIAVNVYQTLQACNILVTRIPILAVLSVVEKVKISSVDDIINYVTLRQSAAVTYLRSGPETSSPIRPLYENWCANGLVTSVI